mgnify:CR=1 FL=1
MQVIKLEENFYDSVDSLLDFSEVRWKKTVALRYADSARYCPPQRP